MDNDTFYIFGCDLAFMADPPIQPMTHFKHYHIMQKNVPGLRKVKNKIRK